MMAHLSFQQIRSLLISSSKSCIGRLCAMKLLNYQWRNRSALLKSNLIVNIREESYLIDLAYFTGTRIQTSDVHIRPVGKIL